MVLAGCGQSPQPEETPPATPDPPVQYTTQWTAPEGRDLFDRAGELVRASVEAGDYALSFGAQGQFADFPPFPGYMDAIGAPYESDPRYTPFYYARGPKKPDTTEWSRNYYLAELTADGTTIDATVCGYSLGSSSTENYSLDLLKDAIHVRLSTTADSPGLPGIPDADPDSTDPRAHIIPSWNVFGDWKIDELVNASLTDRSSIATPCTDWWQTQFPTYTRRDGTPFLYPPEGFVFPTVPDDARQYPEWIGPADSS